MSTGDDQKNLPGLDELGRRLSSAEASLDTDRGRSTVRWAAILGAVALLVGASFTPPGRVVAGEVGELVGIGDEPSVPRHAGNEGDSVVIGTGETPGGQPIELVAFTLNQVRRTGDGPGATDIEVVENSDEQELCFNLDLSQRPESTGGVCITSQHNKEKLDVDGFGPIPVYGSSQHEGSSGIEGADLVVSGLMSAEIADVGVTYRDPSGSDEEATVVSAQLTPELAEGIGMEWLAGAFFAFLPEGVVQSPPDGGGVIDYIQARELIASIEVTGYDAAGDVVAQARSYDADRSAGYLGLWPPLRLVDDLRARAEAAERCGESGIRQEPQPMRPGHIAEQAAETDPELEACIQEKLDAG